VLLTRAFRNPGSTTSRPAKPTHAAAHRGDGPEENTMATDTSTLPASLRPNSGKGFARQLRMKGLIPAVCYGPFDKPVHVAIDPLALKKAIATPHKFNTVIKLQIEGGEQRTVLFKSHEHDPMDGKILHADFLEVRMDKEVDVPVPVVLTGRPVGAAEGGVLQQVLRTIMVRCKPSQIPEKVEVDVSSLGIAESLHVSDIKVQEGVKFRTGATQTVAVVAIPEKLEEVVKPAAVAVEGAAAAPAAGGAAPAAGDAKAGAAAPAAGDAKAPAGKDAGKAPAKK
jgi:large subunit ribosomal protein L25